LSDDCVNEAREGAAIRWWVTSKQEWNKLALIERFRDSPASLEIVTISDPPQSREAVRVAPATSRAVEPLGPSIPADQLLFRTHERDDVIFLL
jgi:hypothetical protein